VHPAPSSVSRPKQSPFSASWNVRVRRLAQASIATAANSVAIELWVRAIVDRIRSRHS
jgi:hypothetical protein